MCHPVRISICLGHLNLKLGKHDYAQDVVVLFLFVYLFA